MKPGEVSDVLTLSWDDYYGAGDTKSFKGEFAYAVARVDKTNPQNFNNFDEWMKIQKEKVKWESFIYAPFFFNWF